MYNREKLPKAFMELSPARPKRSVLQALHRAGAAGVLAIVLSLSAAPLLISRPTIQADPAGVTAHRYYCTWENSWQTTSITSVDIQPSAGYFPLRLNFTPPATASYLLIACYSISNLADNSNAVTEIYQNSQRIFFRSWTPEIAGDYATTGYANVLPLTGGTPYTFQIMLKAAAGTAVIRDASLILLMVSNYYFASDANPYYFYNSTYQDGLSLAVPSTASGDYLVLSSIEISSANPGSTLSCNFARGSTSQAELVRQFSKALEKRAYMTMRVMTFSQAAESLKLQYKVEVPNICNVLSQRIIAVKLSDLGVDARNAESESPSSTKLTSYQTKTTLTFTPSPAKQGDYLVIGFAMLSGSKTAQGDQSLAALDIDNGAYQAERNFQPAEASDCVPLFAFKKYRMLSGAHTIRVLYKSNNPANTTLVKNARILAIKVNTLQSYQDSGVTTRTNFDSGNNTVRIFGYGYEYQWDTNPPAPMPYKVAYYDGGAGHDGLSGARVYTESIASLHDRSIVSTLTLRNVPGASYGTWHAVVYRASTGDTAPAGTFTTNDPASFMEITFTVQAEALANPPPAVSSVALYGSDRTTPVTALSPQLEYACRVSVSSAGTLATLSAVKLTVYYDADGVYTAGEAPALGNTQTAAILTCAVGTVPAWSLDAGPGTTWAIVPANCLQPPLGAQSGDFWFHFRPGKVATATNGSAKWHILAQATNAGGSGSAYQANRTMNWYGEVSVNTLSVSFGTALPGSDFGANQKTGITATYICNDSYRQQIKATSPWVAAGISVNLNASGTPGSGEFSMKADDTAMLGSAQLVSTSYVTIGAGAQTGEAGNTVATNTLWLKLGPSGLPAATYSGAINYCITK